jgi:lipoprotein-anchoring transpeptidase ErfK/SrfK
MAIAPHPLPPSGRRGLRAVGAVVVIAAAALASIPTAQADIGTLSAVNASRVPVTRTGTPLAPGIGRVSATYDSAGVTALRIAFAHPLDRVSHARFAAWSVTFRLGTSVPGSYTACRPLITGRLDIGTGLAGALTAPDGSSVPLAPALRATQTGFSVGDPRLAGSDIACLEMTMTGWRRDSGATAGAQMIPACGCRATPVVVDRLRAPGGARIVWFDGRRPLPPPPPLRGPTARVAWIATVTTPTPARSGPGTGHVVGRLGVASDIDGGPDALLVLGAARDTRQRLWVRVRLDARPNTASGWIPVQDAALATTPWRIVVSLGSTTVRVFDAGHLRYRFRAVIGKPSTPTPTGLFAVAAIVPQADPHGFLGPVALHLTAHSNVLDNYGGGPGRVAIHGRDGASLADPLGTARSHGCIRVQNGWATRLADTVPIGTPVIVR